MISEDVLDRIGSALTAEDQENPAVEVLITVLAAMQFVDTRWSAPDPPSVTDYAAHTYRRLEGKYNL